MKRIDVVEPDSQIYGKISGLRKKLKNIINRYSSNKEEEKRELTFDEKERLRSLG